MDHLPLGDIPMLVSSINFLLRDDEFDNFEQVCYNFDLEPSAVEKLLTDAGYKYDEKQKRII